jgi:hypothetical protein
MDGAARAGTGAVIACGKVWDGAENAVGVTGNVANGERTVAKTTASIGARTGVRTGASTGKIAAKNIAIVIEIATKETILPNPTIRPQFAAGFF